MRVYIEVTEAQHAQLKELAGLVPVSRWIRSQLFPVDDAQRAKDLIPLLKKSIERSNKLIPRGEELATGEASARSNDAPAERRLPKAQAPEEHPRGTPAVDMKRFLP